MRTALLCPALGVLVAACGGAERTSRASSVPAAPVLWGAQTVSVDVNGWRETVSRATASAAVDVRLTVTGPLTVVGGCRPPLQVWLADSSGARVPEPSAGVACQAIVLEQVPAGSARTYEARLPAPTVSGTYTLHGLLAVPGHGPGSENLAVVTVVV